MAHQRLELIHQQRGWVIISPHELEEEVARQQAFKLLHRHGLVLLVGAARSIIAALVTHHNFLFNCRVLEELILDLIIQKP